MSVINKLVGLATVGSTVASVTLLHRFLSGVTSVVALTILGAFMCCILLAGGFAGIYFGLVAYGLDPYAAILTVGVVVLLLMIVFIGFTVMRLRQLRELPYHNLRPDIPALSRMSGAAQAFMDGLLNRRED